MQRSGTPHRRRRAGTILLITAIACGLAGLYVAFQPPAHHTLLEHATRVSGMSGRPTWAIWLSDQEFITLVILPTRNPALTLYRIGAQTGAQTALPGLDTQASTLTKAGGRRYPQLLVSPDGNHLLLHGLQDPNLTLPPGVGIPPAGVKQNAVVTVPDGSQPKQTALAGTVGQAVWMPDGQAWVEQIPVVKPAVKGVGDTIILHRLDGTSHTYLLPAFALPPMAMQAKLLGVTGEGRLLFSTIGQPRRLANGVTFYEVTLTKGTPAVRKYIVYDLPSGTFDNVALAPRGDRLAWQQYKDNETPMSSMIRRHPRTSSVWVSRLDGSGMREIGHVMTDLYDRGLYGVQWLPGGKHLSFYFEDVLYTVPAE